MKDNSVKFWDLAGITEGWPTLRFANLMSAGITMVAHPKPSKIIDIFINPSCEIL